MIKQVKLSFVFFHKRLVQNGGAEKLLINECNSLIGLGHKVKLISYYITPMIKDQFSKKVEINDFSKKRKTNVGSLLKLIHLLSKERKSIIITASGYIDIYLACKTLRIEYNLEDHHPITMLPIDTIRSAYQIKKIINNHYPESRKHNLDEKESIYITIKNSIRFFLYLKIYNSAKKIFVLSEYSKIEKERIFSLPSHILTGGVKKTVQTNKQTPCTRKSIVTISRLSKNKNIDILIKMFNQFLKDNPHQNDCTLEIYGSGDELQKLKKIINQLNLDKQVFLKGYIHEKRINEVLRKTHCFINFQYADFNISVIEAIANLCNIITTKPNFIPFDLDNIIDIDVHKIDIFNQKDFNSALNSCMNRKNMTGDNADESAILFNEKISWDHRAKELTKHFSQI